MMKKNYDIFANSIRLDLPGFARQQAVVNSPRAFAPKNVTSLDWYEVFKRKMDDALEKKYYFPVFRSSHGEFSLVTNSRGGPSHGQSWFRYMASRVFYSLKYGSTFYSGMPGSHMETYPQMQLRKLRDEFAEDLKFISRKGYHCIYFCDRDAYPIKVQKKYYDWLRLKAEQTFTSENYGNIYFVYAYFLGVGGFDIFSGRNILIVNSMSNESQNILRERLRNSGARDVHFRRVPPNQAMLTKLEDLPEVDIDIAIVGAGCGAATVLRQLEPLNCLCVDAGFVVDALLNPERRVERIYSVNDTDWNSYFPNNCPRYRDKFSDIHV